MQRREFIKLTALGAATAVAHGGVLAGGTAHAEPRSTPDGVRWDKAPCRFCGTGCHVQVGVREGRVVAIAGDQQAEVNKGLLCVKGYHVGLALYGKDRLTQPMLRKNSRLEPIGWDHAIDLIVARIEKDPKGFAVYGSGQWTIPEGYAALKLVKAGLGSNQIDPNARLCMASAVTGYLATYGVDEPAGCYHDLDSCNVLIMWGNNPAEMHPVLFSRVIDRRSRGESVVLVDLGTRRTRTTEHCQHYLELRPQTDLALANGIAHLLIKNGTYAKDFVEAHCSYRMDSEPATLEGRSATFAEYCKALEPYTPDHVASITGVSSRDIRMLASLFADRSLRITSMWCMGMNQHTRGTAINTLVHGLHLLSGHFGRPGDAPMSLTGQPSACGTVREVGTLAHALPGGRVVTNEEHRSQAEDLWNVPRGRISAQPGYHTVKLWEQFVTPAAAGGDIHTIWVQVTNPGQTLPNLHKLFDRKHAGEDKLLIVSDVYPTATTQYADLVLPSAMWVEKNGMYGNSERRTQQWFKMVQPPGQARDDAWQIIAVARRLYERGFAGMKDKDGKFLFAITDAAGREVPVWRWESYYTVNVDRHLFEEYRAFTPLKHKNLAPYDEYVKARGLRWPVVQQPDGTWRETRFRFAAFDDPFVAKGKELEFYHSVTHDGRALVWFRPYEPPPEVPDAEYPFWLGTGRVLEHWHSGTLTLRMAPLQRAMPHSYVEMHREDASRLGLQSGERVRVETRRGTLELPVWVDGRGRPPVGTLFIPFFDGSLLVNHLTLDAHDPFSKQPDYKKCAARVVKLA